MSLLFALAMFLTPNPYQNDLMQVPITMSLEAYWLAEKNGIDPEDIVAMMIAEHGGGHPYATDSEGDAGELGLMQISRYWRRQYNTAHATTISADDMLDWRTNMEVAAWTIARMRHTHEVERPARCRNPKRPHHWIAHYRCASRVRGTKACQTKWREGLLAYLTGWRHAIRWTETEGES